MLILKNKKDIQQYIAKIKTKASVGFVPTMGALHQGHISLVKKSKNKCDITICSIYVNPTQFNDVTDLEKYPKIIESDIEQLALNGCDVLYMPETNDIYSNDIDYSFDLQGIEKRWEGPLRPGHFEGVINICYRLFEVCKPNEVFFGQKDFQQCAVIQSMIRHYKLPIIFNSCEIVRELDGLAMSSRNIRLSTEQRGQSSAIPLYMKKAVLLKEDYTPEKLSEWLTQTLNAQLGLQVDYAAVVDTIDLKPAIDWKWETAILVACKVGNIRLLDNIIIPAK